MTNITYVTAYHNIGRDVWSQFTRSFDEYMKSFQVFITLFTSCPANYKMILYIDTHLYNRVKSLTDACSSIKVICISEDWLYENLPMWRTMKTETDIMNSNRYRKLVSHRSHCPECKYPKYTLINHCKIDFICHAINNDLSDSNNRHDIYAWVDFGYFKDPEMYRERVPTKMIGPTKFVPDRINYTLVNMIDDRDSDVIYTLVHAPERVGGFFFCGNVDVMKKYQLLYHQALNYFQLQLGIADDDQAIVLYIWHRYPEMFALHLLHGWHRALTHFQLPS